MQNTQTGRRIVVLGAGFGGVFVARDLVRRSRVCALGQNLTVISRENYFLFTPLLHEVATGGLAPHVIVEPLRGVLGERVDVRLGTVRRVRLADRIVETSAGDVPYDTLVVALGSETNFYGTPGAEEHALQLKDMSDAVRLKRRCIDSFEAAAVTKDPAERAALLRFAVVGGGPTGVEVAAELAEFVHGSLLPMYRGSIGDARPEVIMLQAGPELLPQFSSSTREQALRALRRKGVDVRLNTAVAGVDAHGVTLAGGERVAAHAVLWVAGVKPVTLDFDVPVERDRAGRIVVDRQLRLPGRPEVFVIGDIACSVPEGGSAPLPPFAQVAEGQAAYVAAVIAEESRCADPAGAALAGLHMPFRYRHRGNLVSIGQWMAAAEIGPAVFHGRFAWWLWRTIYLTKFLSRRKKFLIALQWTINLVTPRDVARFATPRDK